MMITNNHRKTKGKIKIFVDYGSIVGQNLRWIEILCIVCIDVHGGFLPPRMHHEDESFSSRQERNERFQHQSAIREIEDYTTRK